jgi:hypothetical protein
MRMEGLSAGRIAFALSRGDKFPSGSPGALQAAAVDALNWVYQTYGNVNAEYAGTVYLDTAGNYIATNPITQGEGRHCAAELRSRWL